MPDFGICESNECELSYRRKAIDNLFERVAVVENRERRDVDIADLLPFLAHFNPFFQYLQACAKCGQPLYRVTQPTANLQADSEEYNRRSRLNKVLQTGYKLQAWDALPYSK
jgi:uncharacterized protein with PIN domain